MVEAVLTVEGVDHAAFAGAGFHDGYAGIGDSGFVGDVELPVNEGAQEVAFAELKHPHRVVGVLRCIVVECFDHFIF